MADDKRTDKSVGETGFSRKVGVKATRKIKAEQDKTNTVWFGLGMMGIVGWSIVVPTLLGVALGQWLDKNQPGAYSWTLALLIAGLCVGCANAWYWVKKEDREIHKRKGGTKQ